jgi:DNA-binding HxlR family transcriptional regulator
VEARTERILRALGTRESLAVVFALLEADTTHTALRRETKLAAQTLEHTLETLSQAGLLERLPGSQGAWHLTQWPEVLAVIRAARRLAIALAGSDDHEAAREAELLDRLDQAAGPRQAAKRGPGG